MAGTSRREKQVTKLASLDGGRLEAAGRRACGTESWRAFRRLAKAGYLGAAWVRGPSRGTNHFLATSDEAETAARVGHLP